MNTCTDRLKPTTTNMSTSMCMLTTMDPIRGVMIISTPANTVNTSTSTQCSSLVHVHPRRSQLSSNAVVSTFYVECALPVRCSAGSSNRTTTYRQHLHSSLDPCNGS